VDTAQTRTLAALALLAVLWPPLAHAQEPEEEMSDEELEELDALMEDEEDGEATGGEGGDEDGELTAEELEELDEVEDVPGNDRLKPITVYYSPEDIAKEGGSTQVLDEERLQELEQDDIHSVLMTVPGVYVRQEDGFGLRPNIGIRGANSERSKKVTLMEDGVLFGPAPYSAPAAYYFPIMSRMTGLEVFKGPGSVAYGPNTIGGSLNLRTREIPNGSKGGVDAAIGSFPSGKLHLWHGIGNERAGLLAEGMHLQSAGFKELDGGGSTGFRRSEVMLKGHVNSDPSELVFHKLTLKGTYSNEQSHETYLGLSDADFEENPYRRYVSSGLDEMNWWRLSLALDYKVEVGDNFDITTTAYRHDFTRAWKKFNSFDDGTDAFDVLQDPTSGRDALYYGVLTGELDSDEGGVGLNIGTNARTFVSQGIQTKARHRHQAKTWSNKLEIGARLHDDQIERDHTAEQYVIEGGQLSRTDEATATTTHNLDQALAFAIYALDQVSISRFTFTPGLRYERIQTSRNDFLAATEQSRSQQVLIPGIGAAVNLYKSLNALAGVHRGFSPVAPGQGEDVSPELSTSYEAGFRWIDNVGTLAEVIGYYNDYSNIIGDCPLAGGCQDQDLDSQVNAGRARIFGAEVAGEHKFPVGKSRLIPVRFSYTYTNATFLSEFNSPNPQFGDVEPGTAIPYVPTHQASGGIGFIDEAFEVRVGGTYVSAMLETADQGTEPFYTDQQLMLDALAAYNFGEKRRLYFKVDNILDSAPIASRRPYGARPIKPRFFQLGFEANWGD